MQRKEPWITHISFRRKKGEGKNSWQRREYFKGSFKIHFFFWIRTVWNFSPATLAWRCLYSWKDIGYFGIVIFFSFLNFLFFFLFCLTKSLPKCRPSHSLENLWVIYSELLLFSEQNPHQNNVSWAMFT